MFDADVGGGNACRKGQPEKAAKAENVQAHDDALPVLFRREMINPGLAKLQPYLFGLSMYFFCLVMMGAGTLGVSRRHWDMAFQGVALADLDVHFAAAHHAKQVVSHGLGDRKSVV